MRRIPIFTMKKVWQQIIIRSWTGNSSIDTIVSFFISSSFPFKGVGAKGAHLINLPNLKLLKNCQIFAYRLVLTWRITFRHNFFFCSFAPSAVFPLTLTCHILLAEEKSSSEEDSKEQSKSTKPMYLKDFERKELLEKGRFVGGVIVLSL